MADKTAAISLLASGQPDPEARRQEMHPFGLYLAATDIERKDRTAAGQDRPARFAAVDALPLNDPAPASRLARFTTMLRRRVARDAGVAGA
jgi:hypothetical protein